MCINVYLHYNAIYVMYFRNYLGIGEDVYNHVPGPCRHIEGIGKTYYYKTYYTKM